MVGVASVVVEPPEGDTSPIVGFVVSTVQVLAAGVGSVVPPRPVARTRKVWAPSERAE